MTNNVKLLLCVRDVSEGVTVLASVDEDSLIAHLFDQQDYNKLIRPVRNRSKTLDVYFEMSLVKLITLVDTRQ